MSNHRQAIAIIKSLTGQANILTIPRIFVDFMGSLDGALFLSQVIYWSDKTSSQWFYKTYNEWKNEICLSKYEVSKQSKKLQKMGLLETKLKKANGAPTVHYKFSFDDFEKSFVKFLDNRKSTNLTNESKETNQSLTETTTETTTNNNKPQKKDYLSHLVEHETGDESIAQPDDFQQHFGYRDDFLKVYNKLLGVIPSQAQKDAIIEAAQNISLTSWERAIRECDLNWSGYSKVPPLQRIIDVALHHAGDYQKWKEAEYGNGDKPPSGSRPTVNIDPADIPTGEDLVEWLGW